jgi:hypothetical protein
VTRGALALGLAAVLLAPAGSQQRPQADPARETVARAALDLGNGKEVRFKYRTLSWSADATRRMRQDPEQRRQMNQRFQLALQTELEIPVPVFLNGRRLEPDTYRVGLAMGDAGAFELTMLLDHDTVRFPIDLAESRISFPYLGFSLLPAEEGLFALVFQWGTEYGRVVFARAG